VERQVSISSSAAGGSDVLHSGASLTVRDLLQMLASALQSSGPHEDLASLPVSSLLQHQHSLPGQQQ
jgi:hypothetical protein